MENQIMEVTKVQENDKEVKTNAQLCADEMDEVLKKYNCTLICQRQDMYGQVVYVPSVVEVKK
jgi:hypothetical protein